ncbi:hypothetical protein NIES4071_57740 [Calothrix sp. NIES-4071]|nr:hypothetical protein NIES4071_57740 [Calothrix sp. NIES-4071]BAZ60081.1 hypothetical protein NIES4105_57690 [Calothrix sp. NIES-4105]
MKRYTNITKEKIQHLLLSKTVEEAAEICGVSISTFRRRMKEYGIPNSVYIQSANTRKLRSEAMKLAYAKDPTLSIRQTKAIRELGILRKGKSNIEFYGVEKAKFISKQNSLGHLGYKHTKETRAKFSQQRRGRILSPEHRILLSKRRKDGFASGRLKLSPKAGFGKGGFRKDIGHYVRSSYEHVFALWLIHLGLYYKYEPQVFTLNINNEVTTFTPDFWVDGYWFEIKNPYNVTLSSFQEKLKEFKLQYPDEVIFIIIGDSTWNNPEAINVTISNLPELVELVAMLKQRVCVKE